jgi:uncharacterized Zn-binding protein involved in type VI secretion
MGMPAATITSMTAHGGTVMVGFPQVLINYMPASRIGDMHVCPMVTGIVPHVGGPFVLGSMTVLTGMMPQSRVSDMLICVGPPDTCVMGAETVLVGEAGAGGAGAAMGGISAMGASVPMQPPATSSSPQSTAEMQPDGTIKTSAPPGGALPPIPLSSPGFPTLPPTETPSFESVQPVTVPAGTPLYSAVDDPSSTPGYWSPDVPSSGDGSLLAVAQAPAGGLQGWMGAASSATGLPAGTSQLWTPPGSLVPNAITQAPWSGAAQMAQQAAQQAMQSAQQAANQAQQAATEAQQQAQQAAQDAAQGAQQAAQQQAQQATQGLPKGL